MGRMASSSPSSLQLKRLVSDMLGPAIDSSDMLAEPRHVANTPGSEVHQPSLPPAPGNSAHRRASGQCPCAADQLITAGPLGHRQRRFFSMALLNSHLGGPHAEKHPKTPQKQSENTDMTFFKRLIPPLGCFFRKAFTRWTMGPYRNQTPIVRSGCLLLFTDQADHPTPHTPSSIIHHTPPKPQAPSTTGGHMNMDIWHLGLERTSPQHQPAPIAYSRHNSCKLDT
jgi:hypothetical protein